MEAAIGNGARRLAPSPTAALVAGAGPAAPRPPTRGRARTDATAPSVAPTTGATQAAPYDARVVGPFAVHVPAHGRRQTVEGRRITVRGPVPPVPRAAVRAQGAHVAVPVASPGETPLETVGARPRPLVAGAGANAHLRTVPVADAPLLVGRVTRQVLQGQEVAGLAHPGTVALAEGAPKHLGRLFPRDADVAPRPGPVAGAARALVEA